MYIIPVNPSRKQVPFFVSTNESDRALLPKTGLRELAKLINSGFARIDPCTDAYKDNVVISARVPRVGRHRENYFAFLGPEKALRALVQDVRNSKVVTEELLSDIFHIQG